MKEGRNRSTLRASERRRMDKQDVKTWLKETGIKLLLWFKAAGARALKTVAQSAIATIGTTAVIREVDWALVGSTALLAGLLSLITSIAGLPELEELRNI